ncbi:MAG: MBG domain-containing protein, partial [Flavitalea sp.]
DTQFAYSIAIDSEGNTYLSDRDNGFIYKVKLDGTKTLFASDFYGFGYGAAVDENYLYLSSWTGECTGVCIIRYILANPENGFEVVLNADSHAAGMNLVIRNGFLYYAGFDCNMIGRVNLADLTDEVYISSGIDQPWSLAFAPNGDLYVGNMTSSTIAKFPAGETSNPVFIADNIYPFGIVVSSTGNLLVADIRGIYKFSPDYTTRELIYEHETQGLNQNINGLIVFSGSQGTGILENSAILSGTPGHEHVGMHPVSIVASNGTDSTIQNFIINVTDPNPPVVKSFSPVNNAGDISLDTLARIIFSEQVLPGGGKIYLRSAATGAEIRFFELSDPEVQLTDSVLSIRLNNLPTATKIYITMDAGLVLDPSGNNFAGISSSTEWAFTTYSKLSQTINFGAINNVVYGDADIDPNAAATSGLNVTYSSSNNSIATILNGKIHVIKAGAVTITASQAGDVNYRMAEPVSQIVTINKKSVKVTLHSKYKIYGDEDPALTYGVEGLIAGDSIIGAPGCDHSKNAGIYPVTSGTINGGDNYEIQQIIAAEFVIKPAKLIISTDNVSRTQGFPNPVFKFKYNGLKGNDLPSDLITEARAFVNAGANSPIGSYEIRITGASSPNYEISYINGTLSVIPANESVIRVWQTNRSTIAVRIYATTKQHSVLTLFNQAGQPLYRVKHGLQPGVNSFTIPVHSSAPGIYILQVVGENINRVERFNVIQ